MNGDSVSNAIRSYLAQTDQPDPAEYDPGKRPVWDLVMEDMRARDETGRQRYGVPLQAHNGRNALVDAYQEGLDLVVYLRQRIEEDTHLLPLEGGYPAPAQRVLDLVVTFREEWRAYLAGKGKMPMKEQLFRAVDEMTAYAELGIDATGDDVPHSTTAGGETATGDTVPADLPLAVFDVAVGDDGGRAT